MEQNQTLIKELLLGVCKMANAKELKEMFMKKIKIDESWVRIKTKEGEEGWASLGDIGEAIFDTIVKSGFGKMLYEYEQKRALEMKGGKKI